MFLFLCCSEPQLVSDKRLTIDDIRQLFADCKSDFTNLQSLIYDIYYSFKQQPIDTSLKSDSSKDIKQLQADCKRCLVPLAGILFQLRSVNGRETELIANDLACSKMGLGKPSVVLVTRAMHEQLVETARSLKDHCHQKEALATLADAIEQHQRKFCDTINSLLC